MFLTATNEYLFQREELFRFGNKGSKLNSTVIWTIDSTYSTG